MYKYLSVAVQHRKILYYLVIKFIIYFIIIVLFKILYKFHLKYNNIISYHII